MPRASDSTTVSKYAIYCIFYKIQHCRNLLIVPHQQRQHPPRARRAMSKIPIADSLHRVPRRFTASPSSFRYATPRNPTACLEDSRCAAPDCCCLATRLYCGLIRAMDSIERTWIGGCNQFLARFSDCHSTVCRAQTVRESKANYF
jgi:hypothetical protein